MGSAEGLGAGNISVLDGVLKLPTASGFTSHSQGWYPEEDFSALRRSAKIVRFLGMPTFLAPYCLCIPSPQLACSAPYTPLEQASKSQSILEGQGGVKTSGYEF